MPTVHAWPFTGKVSKGGRLAFRAEISVEALKEFFARTRGVVGRAQRFGPSTDVLPSARSLRGQGLRLTMSVGNRARHLRVSVERFVGNPNAWTVPAVWSSGRLVPVGPPSSGVAHFLLRFLREATREAASGDRVTITSDGDHSPTISRRALKSTLRPLPNAGSRPRLRGGVFLGMLRAGSLSLAGQNLPFQTRSSTRRLYPVRVGLQDGEASFVSTPPGCIVQLKVAAPDVIVRAPRAMILNSHSVRALARLVDTFRDPNEMLRLHVTRDFFRVTGRDMIMGFGFANRLGVLGTGRDKAAMRILAQVGSPQIGVVIDRHQLLDVLCAFFPATGATMLCRISSGQIEIRRDPSYFRPPKFEEDVTYGEEMPNIVSFPRLPSGPVCPLFPSPENPSMSWNIFNVDAVVTALTKQPTRNVLFSIHTDIPAISSHTCVVVTPARWNTGATYVAVIPSTVIGDEES